MTFLSQSGLASELATEQTQSDSRAQRLPDSGGFQVPHKGKAGFSMMRMLRQHGRDVTVTILEK